MVKKEIKLYTVIIAIIALITVSTFMIAYFFVGVNENKSPGENNITQKDIQFNGNHSIIGDRNNVDYESLVNSTATVYNRQNNDFNSLGSAFVYTDEHLMTNQHVVSGNDVIYIKYNTGHWSKAEVVGSDRHTDIAILEPEMIPDNSNILPLHTDLPRVGDKVIAIGSPNGLEGSVTTGVVSGLNRSVRIGTEFSIPDKIQTDAAVSSGNSGGPLISSKTGSVVGIIRAKGNGEDISYAVSSRIADRIGESLIETGDHNHPYIGIRTVALNPITRKNYSISENVESGIIVADTINETVGNKSFNKFDIILGVDGKRIHNNEDLATHLILNESAGNKSTFKVYRDGNIRNISIQYSSRETADING